MNEKILVINDDDGIREITQLFLLTKGYEIFEADCGPTGIQLAQQIKPDLILLDIIMPEMDGYETCRKLKASAITKDIPVLFFSSLTHPQDKIKGLELGAVDFINSVVDQGELLARVQTHLHIQELRRSLIESNAELVLKQKRLDADLHAAATIQRSFLPKNTFCVPNLRLASLWQPANPLGGDIFNIIPCSQNKVILYMLDVSGHDVPSALVTVSASQYLHQMNASMPIPLSPQKMMVELDKEYPIERFDRFFTIFYIVLDISSGILSYSSAGHPPAILLSQSKGLTLLDRGGTIIGLHKVLPFDEGYETLQRGDKVILYTDGITEMKNENNEFYGTERLCALLNSIQHKSIAEIVSDIQTSLSAFGKHALAKDDISILGFEFK